MGGEKTKTTLGPRKQASTRVRSQGSAPYDRKGLNESQSMTLPWTSNAPETDSVARRRICDEKQLAMR